MVLKQFTTPESTNRTQTHTVNLSGLVRVDQVKSNTGSVILKSVNGDNVSVEVSGGESSRQELLSGSYTPSASKDVTSTRSGSSSSFASTIAYSEDGYSGTLYKSGSAISRLISGTQEEALSKRVSSSRSIVVSWVDWEYRSGGWVSTYTWMANIADTSPISYKSGGYSGILHFTGFSGTPTNASPPSSAGKIGQKATTNRYQTANYSGTVWTESSDTRVYSYTQNYVGTVTKGSIDTRQYRKYYQYELEFTFQGNQVPIGTAIPAFNAEIGGERIVQLGTHFSDPDGDALTFTGVSSNDQIASVTRSASNVANFTIKAESVGTTDILFTAADARGEIATRSVKVTVMNRLPVLTLNTDIDYKVFEGTSMGMNGTVLDADIGHIVNVKYRINSQTPRALITSVSPGTALPFQKTLLFRDLKIWDGVTAITDDLPENTNHVLTVWAEDDYGGKTPNQVVTFTVTHNRPPNVKPMIDRSGYAAATTTIDLSQSFTDPDGDILTYTVSSSVPGIVTTNVTGNSLKVVGAKSGVTIITVHANDGKGRVASGSFQYHVVNRAPTITVYKADNSQTYLNEHLGDYVAAFLLTYAVADLDQVDKLHVTERVNGVDTRVIREAVRGDRHTFDLANAWGHVKVGENVLSITVSDGAGSTTTKTHGFRASGNELRFSLKAPIVTSLPAERMVLSGHTDIKPGATFNVRVTNNANDAAPTWEDATQHFNEGTVHRFQNTTKTAATWAINVEFRITQGTSVLLSSISGFGFAFE